MRHKIQYRKATILLQRGLRAMNSALTMRAYMQRDQPIRLHWVWG